MLKHNQMLKIPGHRWNLWNHIVLWYSIESWTEESVKLSMGFLINVLEPSLCISGTPRPVHFPAEHISCQNALPDEFPPSGFPPELHSPLGAFRPEPLPRDWISSWTLPKTLSAFRAEPFPHPKCISPKGSFRSVSKTIYLAVHTTPQLTVIFLTALGRKSGNVWLAIFMYLYIYIYSHTYIVLYMYKDI